jgi:penicillin-binding protein 1C
MSGHWPSRIFAVAFRTRWRRAAVLCGALAVVAIAGFATWVVSLGPPPLGENLAFSKVVVDRDDRLLRPFATADGRWRLPARVADVDRRFIDLLIAYEDRRFRNHAGVDPRAVARALWQLASERRIVSGGSTLTMQVARLLEPRSERSVMAKLRQMLRAVEIERALGKDDILNLYLSLAPYGGNLEGVRAAALAINMVIAAATKACRHPKLSRFFSLSPLAGRGLG